MLEPQQPWDAQLRMLAGYEQQSNMFIQIVEAFQLETVLVGGQQCGDMHAVFSRRLVGGREQSPVMLAWCTSVDAAVAVIRLHLVDEATRRAWYSRQWGLA